MRVLLALCVATLATRSLGAGFPQLSTADPLTVTLPNAGGSVVGAVDRISGAVFWKGIPYAAPPTGANRFQAPQPAAPLGNSYNATEFGPGCMAICPPEGFPKPKLLCAKTISEDCLYLNVYKPANHTTGVDAALPVVFFIHGGNYMYGSGGVMLYDGSDFAVNENLVIVTINYRLGILGGLFFGFDSPIRGNYQTQDQRFAMQWVQRNIGAFGGDPTNVLLCGQSAGAFSTATHLTSPASRGLFAKAAIVSDPFALQPMNASLGPQLAAAVTRQVGCPAPGEAGAVECMMNVSAQTILDAQAKSHYNMSFGTLLDQMMPWVPVVTGTDELPEPPLVALQAGRLASRVPVFFGTVANESVEFIYRIAEKPLPVWEYDGMVEAIFGLWKGTQALLKYGRVPPQFRHDVRPFLSVMATDYIFYCPNRWVGAGMAKVVPTYMWLFDYQATASEWMFNASMPYCVHSVCHAADLQFYFNSFRSVPPEWGVPMPTPAESNLARQMQAAWGSFLRTDSPNPIANDIVLPTFTVPPNPVINFSIPISPLQGYRDNFCDFWDRMGYNRG